MSIHRHALHHRSVVVGGLDAGGFHVGVERLKQAGQLLRTGGLRGEDAGCVRGDHAGLDLGPVVVERRAIEGQGEVGILLLGCIDEGLPLGAVVVRGDPGVHLVHLVRARATAGRRSSRTARACEQGEGRGGRTECEELGDSGAHDALLPCQGHRGFQWSHCLSVTRVRERSRKCRLSSLKLTGQLYHPLNGTHKLDSKIHHILRLSMAVL